MNLWWSSCAIVLKTTHLHLLRHPLHSRPRKQTNWGDFRQTQQHYDCMWETASTKQRGGARKQGSGYGKSTCSPWWPARPCARLPNGTQSRPVCESHRIQLHVSGGGGGGGESHVAECALQLPSLPQPWLRGQTQRLFLPVSPQHRAGMWAPSLVWRRRSSLTWLFCCW